MLHIENIHKKYVTGDLVQTALDGVSLTLRDCEFVAILGPSGSGKTTLLNVIGGLDRYDSGDLIINGISTKKYSDRDWDSYRNHTIGFVFQSYNLIPHQTVLANVELALTISGISRSERRKRAKKALEDVGLGNQLHKKPNQMSGGQMQRVAIARALVNNPDILLADEPTGALDSETSVQVMELLKEVSKDRLVVMVTHNPELAEEYANRIVRVKDGKIIDDTNPYTVDISAMEPPRHKNMGKSSMSFLTALTLSFNNLSTKKARTLLTAFAGSIGIIGIALILSLSTGFQRYIDKIQEDTLSSYPLSIQSETADMASAMAAVSTGLSNAEDMPEGTVLEQQMISQMFAQIGSNDLASFKTYLEENFDQVDEAVNTVRYYYGVKPRIYSADTSDGALQVNPGILFGKLMGSSAMSAYMDSDVFQEMIDNRQLLESQYDVLQGKWPESYNEMVFVLSDPNRISDYMSYTLGLRDMDALDEMMQKVMNGEEAVLEEEPMTWTYDELMAMRFKLVPAASLYRYNAEYRVWEDMSDDDGYMKALIDNGEELKIVGIVCPKEGVSATTLSTGIAYTSDLTQYVIDTAKSTDIVKNQLADEKIDVFTGKEFGAEEENQLSFEDMISVDSEMLTSAFGMDVDEDAIIDLLEDYMGDIGDSLTEDIGPAREAFSDTLADLGTGFLNRAIRDQGGKEAKLVLVDASQMVDDYLATKEASSAISKLAKKYSMTADAMTQVYKPLLVGMVTAYIAEEMAQEAPAAAPASEITTETTVPTAAPMETTTEPTEEVTEPTQSATEATEPATEATQAPTEPSTTPTQPSTAPTVDIQPTLPSIPDVGALPEIDMEQFYATITPDRVETVVSGYSQTSLVRGTAGVMAAQMNQANAQKKLMSKLSGFGNVLMRYMGGSMTVDEEKIAGAFQFQMNEEELRRLMAAMSSGSEEASAASNLRSLGYADVASPNSMSVYFVDFASKELFMEFLDGYNADMEAAGKEDQVISYTDVTGIMMSSVRTIIDSVSYVLIAFVAVSLVVSSIMIGIITYISVMERTKEIGVLRAIGASKRNISQVFNAETFIIGLCSGLIGVGVTLLLIFPINDIIHAVTESNEINAQLPVQGAVILIFLSMVLTLIGGLIPSQKAAKKDPVIALRSE